MDAEELCVRQMPSINRGAVNENYSQDFVLVVLLSSWYSSLCFVAVSSVTFVLVSCIAIDTFLLCCPTIKIPFTIHTQHYCLNGSKTLSANWSSALEDHTGCTNACSSNLLIVFKAVL